MTNVSDLEGGVKRPAASVVTDAERDALEISRLLVEVLQVGHAGRRSGADHVAADAAADAAAIHGSMSAGRAGEAAATAAASPLASHVIRAAIYVYAHGPQTIGQLAAGLGVSQGWASRVVDEMEQAGYLQRTRDEADRRVVRVSLTEMAVVRVEAAYRWRGDAVELALEGMAEGERAAVAAFLRRFVEAARAEG